jgi:hypothetical protein
MVSKANQKLGLVKRVCRDITDISTRKLLFCSLVLPHLEYCSSIWSPLTVKHQALVENVQRRATKFILTYPPCEVSYTDRLKNLGLLPLRFRRELNDLILLFKCRCGTIHLNCEKYFSPVSSCYSTRNFDPNNLNIITDHKQNYYRNSFFPRVIELWNNLLHDLKSLS